MAMAPLEFQLAQRPKYYKTKGIQDIQKSVDMLFEIIYEYSKLEKKAKKLRVK